MMTRHDEDIAIVLAAHGDRGGGFTNSALFAHRHALDAAARFVSVSAGVLKGDPALEEALAVAQASGAGRILIYPFFMADGFFVRTRLSERVAAANLRGRWEILPPLGVDPGLPPIILDQAVATAEAAGFAPAATTLLVAGHGSKLGPASADATRAAAATIAEAGVFHAVATAFLEEPPSVEDALRAVKGPVVVSGFFSGEGMHAADDIPTAIANSRVRAVYAGPVGSGQAVSALMLKRIISSR
jgi:sirohydrochlorin ferrochelatase